MLDAHGFDAADTLRPLVPVMAGATAVGAIVSQPGGTLENVVAVLAVLPFIAWAFVWRRMPILLLVGLAAVGSTVALQDGDLEPLLFLMCVSTTVVAGWERSATLIAVGGALAVFTPWFIEAIFPDEVIYGVWTMGILLSLLLPLAFRRQISLVTSLAEAREELTRQASVDERRAIARDVHDLVGHGLAAVLLHVTGARHVLRRDPDAADEALADAERIGRQSLQELRRTIGILREAEGAEGAEGAGNDGATSAPVPGVQGLTDVIAASQAAGLDTSLQEHGDLGRVDPIVGLSLHRVAEEALNNARHHAPRAVTDVVVAVEDGAVTLTVDTVGPLREPDPADADRPRYGIVGMRERMAAVGGELEVGPTPSGWRVSCRAPLAPLDGIDEADCPGNADNGDVAGSPNGVDTA